MAAAEDPQALLIETIARHFPEATTSPGTVELGFGGLRLGCAIGVVRPLGGMSTVQLLFELDGGGLRAPVELAMTGYEASELGAVIEGACRWACSFGPVLRAAFTGEQTGTIAPFAVMQRGQRYSGWVDFFDRVLQFTEAGEDTVAARSRLQASPNLALRVMTHDAFPVLPRDRPTVLSIVVTELDAQRIVEIKVDNHHHDGFADLVAGAPPQPHRAMIVLRELAVINPRA